MIRANRAGQFGGYFSREARTAFQAFVFLFARLNSPIGCACSGSVFPHAFTHRSAAAIGKASSRAQFCRGKIGRWSAVAVVREQKYAGLFVLGRLVRDAFVEFRCCIGWMRVFAEYDPVSFLHLENVVNRAYFLEEVYFLHGGGVGKSPHARMSCGNPALPRSSGMFGGKARAWETFGSERSG